jgi:hypothetical protein
MNVSLCIANGALCSERTSCTRSGWRKPAVGNTGMLAGEKRISATTLAHAAKSGWRKPAVVSEPRLQKRNRDSPVTTTGRSLQRNAVASALPTHGGLTPAALGFAFASRWTMFDSRGTACGSPNHGGLTPAALVNVRLCIANGALCSERTSCTRSGWREPAVGNTGMLAGEKRISATTLAHAAKSGWRKPAVVREPRLQKRNRDSPVTTTGGFNKTPLRVRY